MDQLKENLLITTYICIYNNSFGDDKFSSESVSIDGELAGLKAPELHLKSFHLGSFAWNSEVTM